MEQYYDYNSRLAVKDRLFTPLHGVRLTGGLFRRVFDDNIAFTLTQLDMARMRYWFDIKRGIPTDAMRYNGHFEDNLKGQTASQFLMCAGNALRWEENPELRARMDEIVDTIDDTAEPDGFMLPIDKRDFATKEYPGYVRIWLTYGLVAAARGGNPKALKMLRKWQDWFNACPDLPVIRHLLLAFQGVVASPSVFFTEVGKEEDMAVTRQRYEETWRLAQFIGRERDAVHIRRQPGYEPHPHGSELESFEGYLDLYRHCGAPYLLNAVKGAWELYRRDWRHPGGGIVMCEFIKAAHPGCNLIYPEYYYNELCCTSFWLHLNQRLHRLFPDEEQYVEEMEESLYNVAIANQDGARHIRYFAHLHGRKFNAYAQPNHCCSGVGTRIFASLPEYLYTMTKETLSCDIYASSVLEWQTTAQTVTVTQKSDMPNGGQVRIAFKMATPQKFALRLRIPAYAAASSIPIYINGKEASQGKAGTYLVLERTWQDGDEIAFELPMAFAMHPYSGDHGVAGYDRCAYTYGPLLMALVGPFNHEKGRVLPGNSGGLLARLKPTGTPLTFAIDGVPDVTLRPYFELQREQFTCFPLFAR